MRRPAVSIAAAALALVAAVGAAQQAPAKNDSAQAAANAVAAGNQATANGKTLSAIDRASPDPRAWAQGRPAGRAKAPGFPAEPARAHGIPPGKVVSDIRLKSQPNKQFATVQEIGGLTAFLCSDLAASMTGAALAVDGGWTAQ